MQNTVERENLVPSGWLAFTPMVKHSFKFGTAKVLPFEDRSSGFIVCSEESETEFGALMQTFEATEFVGKIVCFEGMTKIDGANTRSEILLEVNVEVAYNTEPVSAAEKILQTPSKLDFMDATDFLPELWHIHCRNTDEFRTAIHCDDAANGRYLSIACLNPKRTYAAGAVLQTFDAAYLRGDMIELSALLKSEDVIKQSGLFIRVNGPSRLLERMDNGPIIGSIEWKLYKVRLNVPPEAISVSIGFYLEGGGRLCIKQVAFSKIESEVFTLPTSISLSRRPLKPVNLELN